MYFMRLLRSRVVQKPPVSPPKNALTLGPLKDSITNGNIVLPLPGAINDDLHGMHAFIFAALRSRCGIHSRDAKLG
jgi:hypothetical protein